MQVHQRGLDLLADIKKAEEHFDEAKPEELRQLISEAIVVFGQLLERDIPDEPNKPVVGDRPAGLI